MVPIGVPFVASACCVLSVSSLLGAATQPIFIASNGTYLRPMASHDLALQSVCESHIDSLGRMR
eukprot:scaffold94074_cov33-Tisochrysis_lutea.AAC.1